MRRGKYPRPPFGGAAITTRKAKPVSYDEHKEARLELAEARAEIERLRRERQHAIDVANRTYAQAVAAEAERDELRAEIERLRDSERLAWAVHREHVDRMNPMLLRERSLRDEARRERDALRAQVEAALDLTRWAIPSGYASFRSGNGPVPMVRWDELHAALSSSEPLTAGPEDGHEGCCDPGGAFGAPAPERYPEGGH